MSGERALVPVEDIAQRIHTVRSQRVILDLDLASLYGVETRVLNQAVKRNSGRFPPDFVIRLSRDEVPGRRGPRHLPGRPPI